MTDLPGLDPAAIRKVATANLLKRLADGGRSTAEERAELQKLAQAGEAATLAKAVADLTAALQTAGHLTPALRKTLARLANPTGTAAEVWPNTDAAAADLGRSSQTVRNWCGEIGLPTKQIPKVALLLHAWEHHAKRKEVSEVDRLKAIEAQTRIDERSGRITTEARDAARDATLRLARDLRDAWTAAAPEAIAAAIVAAFTDAIGAQAPTPTPLQVSGIIRRLTNEHLDRVAEDLRTASAIERTP